jgi:4-amino-4-deoxy-L-arabinose transferase-like glycosyltransferase
MAVAVAAILRLWRLSTVPPHLTPDEAALGYNAYSILKTGKDEYGNLLPIIFKSFGDYKPGLYIYLTVPFVALFGLNEFAVRLPSALMGVAAVWLIYLIVRELFPREKKFSILNSQFSISEIAAFLLAINPWHVHFSRGAWEVNVSLTLTLAGIYFFLKSLKEAKFLYLSAISFALTLLTYQGAKLATAIAILVLIIAFWRDFWASLASKRGPLFGSLLVGFLISLPIMLSFFQGKTGRLEVFSLFSYPRPPEYTQAFLDQVNEKVGSLNYYLYYSESLNFARAILGRWFNHFSGRFLFFEGDWQNPRHSAPNQGMLLLADLVFLIAGTVSLVRLKNKTFTFIFLWLILAPLPAALSRDQVQAVRAYNMTIPLTMISAFGLAQLIAYANKIRKPTLHTSYYILLIATIFGAIIYFLDAYFVHLPKHDAKYWFYGYKQAVEAITPVQGNYEKIVFQQSYNQPYIYFLFYQRYDPAKYQKRAKLTESGIDVGLVENLDNISFESFSWPYSTDKKGTMVVGDSIVIPDDFNENDFKLISEIKYPDKVQTAFRILEAR